LVKGRTATEAGILSPAADESVLRDPGGEIATQAFQRFAEFACSEIALGDDASYIYC
jgi:hypothetical protein